jgi:hypothetical protein
MLWERRDNDEIRKGSTLISKAKLGYDHTRMDEKCFQVVAFDGGYVVSLLCASCFLHLCGTEMHQASLPLVCSNRLPKPRSVMARVADTNSKWRMISSNLGEVLDAGARSGVARRPTPSWPSSAPSVISIPSAHRKPPLRVDWCMLAGPATNAWRREGVFNIARQVSVSFLGRFPGQKTQSQAIGLGGGPETGLVGGQDQGHRGPKFTP